MLMLIGWNCCKKINIILKLIILSATIIKSYIAKQCPIHIWPCKNKMFMHIQSLLMGDGGGGGAGGRGLWV